MLGHDSRLAQVFDNIIENARSFSPPGGRVRILLRPESGIDMSGYRREGYEILIDDDGPGIPQGAFERVFERFYTDRPDQGFGNNSGLGLSISRQIVEAHGGRIRALNRTRRHPEGTDEADESDGPFRAISFSARVLRSGSKHIHDVRERSRNGRMPTLSCCAKQACCCKAAQAPAKAR